MTPLDTVQTIEQCLKQMLQKAAGPDPGRLSGPEAAYARGLEDALELVCRHRQQSSAPPETKQTRESARLCRMSPEQVAALDLDAAARGNPEQFSRSELVEAAFRFENDLMACLGDENCMDWDVYAGLSTGQLLNIIRRSVLDICRHNKG